MNCQDFEKTVLVMAQSRLLDVAAYQQSLTHAEECVGCAARLAEERALIAGVRAVCAEIADQEAPPHVEAQLLTAFREQAKAVATPALAGLPGRSRRRLRRNLTAIAAGILILISAVAILWAQSNSLTRQRKELAGPQAPSPANDPQTPSPAPKEQKLVSEAAQKETAKPARPHHTTYRNRQKAAEVATEFFPLMEGDDLDSLDSGQIVRVELSGAALLAVGLPVEATIGGEPIKADVVLGHDGMARAIRFIR